MTASFADNEIWHVLIAADDMKRMNVEQLDDAFRLSLVDSSTMVWKAGMNTWQRLGAVAGIDDDDELEDSVTRMRRAPAAPPPPPRPMARPAPKPPSPRSLVPAPPPAPRPAPQAFYTSTAPVFAAPLVAPVYSRPVAAPDPYTLPKRRVAIPSEVNFRRSSHGVRWGRWLVALLLVTGGVLAAYRQNLLREGARRLGVENKYLYGERRVTAFVSAKAPYAVKNALTRAALLPGPNAAAAPTPPARPLITATPVAAAAAPAPLAAPVAPSAASAAPSNDPEVKTVSLDSLPMLGSEPAPPAVVAPAPAARRATPAPALSPEPKAKPRKLAAPTRDPAPKAEPKPKAVKAEPKPKAPASPAVVASDNPLKAAIRSAIAADAAKAK